MTQIVEFAIEFESAEDFEFLQQVIHQLGFAYYVEPQGNNPYRTLDEVEADCEGK